MNNIVIFFQLISNISSYVWLPNPTILQLQCYLTSNENRVIHSIHSHKTVNHFYQWYNRKKTKQNFHLNLQFFVVSTALFFSSPRTSLTRLQFNHFWLNWVEVPFSSCSLFQTTFHRLLVVVIVRSILENSIIHYFINCPQLSESLFRLWKNNIPKVDLLSLQVTLIVFWMVRHNSKMLPISP